MSVSAILNINQKWKTVIGLEIHAQLKAKSKLFSISKYFFQSPPNSCVGYFDMAMPGTLPILNRKCVELATLAAVALKCNINHKSEFDRKHYFYADMPSGYQITQHRSPLARNGSLAFLWSTKPNATAQDVRKSKVEITQIHLEQDSGKSIHNNHKNLSLIDLNRAGVGLIEIVTAPSLRHPLEAAGLVTELRDLLHDIGACEGRMEEGGLRVDANVSVAGLSDDELGQRTEIKNIGSIRGVWKAIEFEAKRQISVLESGGEVINETRFYDPVNECTVSMRDKEVIQDYRHMPEPNLPVLQLQESCDEHIDDNSPTCIECTHKRIVLLKYPSERRIQVVERHGVSLEQATAVIGEPGLCAWLDGVVTLMGITDLETMRVLGHCTVTWLVAELRQRRLTIQDSGLSGQAYAEYVRMCSASILAASRRQTVLSLLLDHHSLDSVLQMGDFYQINDVTRIRDIVDDFFQRHPKTTKRKKLSYAFRFYITGITTEQPLLNQKLLEKEIAKRLN